MSSTLASVRRYWTATPPRRTLVVLTTPIWGSLLVVFGIICVLGLFPYTLLSISREFIYEGEIPDKIPMVLSDFFYSGVVTVSIIFILIGWLA